MTQHRSVDPHLKQQVDYLTERVNQLLGVGGRGINRGAALTLSNFDQLSGQLDSIGGLVNRAIPPRPTNLVVNGGFGFVHLEWDKPNYANHGYTEIWRNAEDNRANAIQIGQELGFQYGDTNVTYDQEYFYWIRFVSTANVTGPFNDDDGTPGTTNVDPAVLLAELSDKILSPKIDLDGNIVGYGPANGVIEYSTDTDSPALFTVPTFAIRSPGADSLSFTVSDGKVVMDAAYIVNLVVRDADIESLSVAKLVGLTSSFILSNIGTGNITNAYIGNIIQSDNYVPGVSGWRVNKDGSVEFGAGVFRGTLQGADGTFSGTLTANAVDAVDTINLRGNSVIITEVATSAGQSNIPSTGTASMINRSINLTGAKNTNNLIVMFSADFYLVCTSDVFGGGGDLPAQYVTPFAYIDVTIFDDNGWSQTRRQAVGVGRRINENTREYESMGGLTFTVIRQSAPLNTNTFRARVAYSITGGSVLAAGDAYTTNRVLSLQAALV